MVDSTIEISENLPVASFIDETAEKLPVTNTLEINTPLNGAKKAYNYSRLVRNLYTDVGVQVNITGKSTRIFDRHAKRLLKLNIGSSNGYELYPPKALYNNTIVNCDNSKEILSLSISTNIYPYDIKRETSKQYFIKNIDIAGKQISNKNLSAVNVRFYKDINEKRNIKKRLTKRYLIFEKCNPLNYNFIPVSDKKFIKLNERNFNFLKEKSECYSKALRDRLCMSILSCERSLEDCFSSQTNNAKKLFEEGKLNIMRALHYNLEGIDIGTLAKDNGFDGALKKIYLNTFLVNLKACLNKMREQYISGDCSRLEHVLYEYNHTAEVRGWRKANEERMLTMIKGIPSKGSRKSKKYKKYRIHRTF